MQLIAHILVPTSGSPTCHSSPSNSQSTSVRRRHPRVGVGAFDSRLSLSTTATPTGTPLLWGGQAMGSVSLAIGDGTARFRRSSFLCSSLLPLLMLLSVIATNLLALYAFTRSPHTPNQIPNNNSSKNDNNNLSLVSQEVSLILGEISSAQRQLSLLQRDLLGFDSLDVSNPSTPPELRLFLSPLPLPLGPDSKTKISHMSSSVSHLCSNSLHLLYPFMSYTPFHLCPISNTSSLLSRRCDPLPRRRCLSPRSSSPPHLLPFPSSLWGAAAPSPFLDKLAFVKPRGKNDFHVDDVLALASPPGSIRTGLDLAGSSAGNLAARMAERGVTVVTLVPDPKVGEAVAARGLFPLQVTPGHRFPFHDGVFDLVHTVELDDGGAGGGDGMEGVEFLMFDVDRVLRSGGLFWLDNYWCVDSKRKAAVTALIERFKFKKLKWVVGEKVDTAGGGMGKPRVYLSAVLQKPARG